MVSKLCRALVTVVSGAFVLCQLVSPQVALVRERGLTQVTLPSYLWLLKVGDTDIYIMRDLPVHVLIVCAFWGFPALWTQHHTGHMRTSHPRAPSICACNSFHEIYLSKSWQRICEWRGASIYIQYEGSEGLCISWHLLNVRKWHILAQGSVSVLLNLRMSNLLSEIWGFCNCQDSLIEVSLGRELGSAMLAGEPDAFVLAQLMPVHIFSAFSQFSHLSQRNHASYAFLCLAYASSHLSLLSVLSMRMPV